MSKYFKKYTKYKNKYTSLKKRLFPSKIGLNADDLKISVSSPYSMSDPVQAKKITDLILSFLKENDSKNKTITECCANVGGNTISFATQFQNVNAIEMGGDEYNNLVHNIKKYKLDNVTTINADYTKIMHKLKQDIIFFDPPWGGPIIGELDKVDLFLSEINVADIIYDILEKSLAKLIALKAPRNYNESILFAKFENTKYKVKKFGIMQYDKLRYYIYIIKEEKDE